MKPKYVGGYVDQTDTLHLLYRESGVLHEATTRARWTTYFRATDVEPHRAQIERSPYVVSAMPEGDWFRVDWKSRDARKSIMVTEDERGRPIENWFRVNGVDPHEVDVHPLRRFFVDTDAEVEPAPRIAYLDIETDSRLTFTRKHEMRVLCACVVAGCDAPESDVRKGEHAMFVLDHDTDVDEARLLIDLFNWLETFDVVAAWYGDGFDFEVLRARARAHGLSINFQRWRFLDHLEVFKGLNSHIAESGEEKQSMALNTVAQAVLGEGKHDFDSSKTWQAWEAGGAERQRMFDYCRQDTELLLKIEERTGYIALFGTMCAACKLFVETYSLKSTAQMDGFMLRLGKERGFHFPSKFDEPIPDRYAGAFVLHPECKGIQHDVHVADFSSLYPSIIISWNMSPETVDHNVPVNGPIAPHLCRAPSTGISFRTDIEGMLPVALKTLIAMRKKWNDLKASLPPGTPEWVDADRWSMAYKVLANSFYGVLGSIFSRYYDRGIAESVTTSGAWLIKATIHEAKQWGGFETIYGDTDSIFVAREGDGSEIGSVGYTDFMRFVEHCNANLYPDMLKRQGCKANRISLAYEKAFKRLALVSAKKYVGVYAHYKGKPATADSKPEVKGLEYKRGDTVRLARQMQGEVIDLFVRAVESADEYDRLVERWKLRVLEAPLDIEDVVLSQSLSMPIEEYKAKTPPAHVRVASLLKERGEDVSVGVKIAYFVVDGKPDEPGGAKVAPASDWTGECDRFALWENLVYPATQRLLEASFPEYDWTRHAKVRPRKRRGKGASGEDTLALPLPAPSSLTRGSQGATPAPTPRPPARAHGGPSVLPRKPAKPTPQPPAPAEPVGGSGPAPLARTTPRLPQASQGATPAPAATRIAVTLDARDRPEDDPAPIAAVKALASVFDALPVGATPVRVTLLLDGGEVELAVERKVELRRSTIATLQKTVLGLGKVALITA